MSSLIAYWRQGEATQNFGDFLAQYLFEELFLPVARYAAPAYLIGSVIADFLVPAAAGDHAPPAIFWGCGARDETGLSAEAAERARILSVRGPLTASALRLGATVPQGDPALLLPALYTPKPDSARAGRTICLPHFWDRRTDAELRELSGCNQVLRTNLPNERQRLLELVDAIAASDFVLSASLHGAIVAAAYGRPFAFWHNGHLDLPFKWADTAALLSIPTIFATNLMEAKRAYRDQISPSLRLPRLTPLLTNAPFPLRPEAVLRILAFDLAPEMRRAPLELSSSLRPDGVAVRDLLLERNRCAAEVQMAAHRAERLLGQSQADATAQRDAAEMARARCEILAEEVTRGRQFQAAIAAQVAPFSDGPDDNLVARTERLLIVLREARDAADAEMARMRDEADAADLELAALRHDIGELERSRDRFVAEREEAWSVAQATALRLETLEAMESRMREELRAAEIRGNYETGLLREARQAGRAMAVQLAAGQDEMAQIDTLWRASERKVVVLGR